MHDNIESSLKADKQLFLWLCVSPYCDVAGNGKLNISKSLEHQIMSNHNSPDDLWNKRNKGTTAKEWRVKHCINITDILKEHDGMC
ncbi:hypothetical protein CMT41_14875 [Colwellia sp. MT41]|uniref:Endonuclease n=1 Tax=Colwellia marinimaniae TaxID=1513592 RepID=A0ABQ0MQK1_9GAMM|nr:hypothetical protein CMT41_14875 [Colwellia sp. MT41]GAW94653.1 hypothetical protein MTCD1_00250 [Colwellia marinimaniae]